MSQLGKIGALIQEGSLYVLLFLLPFSNAAVEIGFGILLLGWVMRRLDPRTRRESCWFHPQLRSLAVSGWSFAVICVFSIVVSDHPGLSVSGVVNKWLEYLAFTWMVVDLGSAPGVAKRSTLVMTASSGFVAIEALTQQLFKKGLFRHQALLLYGRATGPYRNPTDLATYLMVIIPIVLCVAIRRRQAVVRWGLSLLAGILVWLFIRTETLGAWLGISVAVGGMTVLSNDNTTRRIGLVVLGGGLIMALITLAALGRLGTTLSASNIGQVDRRYMWAAAVNMIKDRPVLGHGVNTFMANYLHYWVGGEQQPRYAHNCYLQMAAETGIVGLAVFLWLLWTLHARIGVALRTKLSSDEAQLLLGLWVGLVAFAVQSAVDTNFYSLRQAALFWVLAGLAVGLSMRTARLAPPHIWPGNRVAECQWGSKTVSHDERT